MKLTRASSYAIHAVVYMAQVKEKDKPIIAVSMGHGEPDLQKPDGPLKGLVEGLGRKAWLAPIELGGAGLIAEQVKALLEIGRAHV